jgi:hypothetical protein
MKQIIVVLIMALSISTAGAQISVKVRKTNSGGDVDIKTSGKPKTNGTSPGTEGQTTPPSTEPKTTPTSTKDTASRPVATSSYDESYQGPAKVQLKAFWRQLEKLRDGDMAALNNAERMLGQVKQNDPSYNVSLFETEVAEYRANVNKATVAKSNAANAAEAEKKYFQDVWHKMIGVYSKGSIIEPGVTGKTYLDKVQAVNLTEYTEKKPTASSTEAKKFVEMIDEMLADYENYLKRTDRLRWNVTEVMVKARNEANPQTKMKMLEQAKYECEAVLMMSAGNTTFQQKLDEVNKLLGNADAEAAKNYTSDFHKQNVGKIVWSNKPLVIGKEKDMQANIKNEFKSGEAIFGTIYLGNTAKQLMNGNEMLRVIIKVDGGTAIWGGDLSYFILPLTVQDKSYVQFALLPDDEWYSKNYAPYVKEENWTYSYLMDDLVKAGDISHTITCEFDFPSTIQSNIKSSLSLDLSSGITQLKTQSVKLHDQLMASRTLPKAGMSNAALEQQMLAAANNLGWNDKFLKTVITSSSWSIAKNDITGAILYRYLGAVCTTKSADGKCYYQEFTFRQDYTGGGNYSNIIKNNSYGSKREIGCDKLK